MEGNVNDRRCTSERSQSIAMVQHSADVRSGHEQACVRVCDLIIIEGVSQNYEQLVRNHWQNADEVFEFILMPSASNFSPKVTDNAALILNTFTNGNVIRIFISKSNLSAYSPYFFEMISESNGGCGVLNNLIYDYVRKFLLRIDDFHDEKNQRAHKCIKNHLAGLILSSLEEEAGCRQNNVSPSNGKLLRRIRAYVQENLTDPDISPTKIANECGISVSYLHKLFKRTGTPITRWIMDCRLELCRQKIIDSSYHHIPLSSIAFDAGFNNQAHFSAKFKKHFGKNPSAMRLEAISNSVNTPPQANPRPVRQNLDLVAATRRVSNPCAISS